MARYIAYADLGVNGRSGEEIDPDAFGGEDSEEFQDMLAHRSILRMGDRDSPPPPEGVERPIGPAEGAQVRELNLTQDEIDMIFAARAKKQAAFDAEAAKGPMGGTKEAATPPSSPPAASSPPKEPAGSGSTTGATGSSSSGGSSPTGSGSPPKEPSGGTKSS